MTEPQITNQDLTMTLAQIEDTLARAADPAALFEGAKAHLGALYNQAEAAGNNEAIVAINESWTHIQSLAAAAQQNHESYLIAKDIAGTFQTQRDEAMKEHKELIDAIEHFDTDNPLVSDLVEGVTEANNEEAAYWYDEQIEETIFERLQDSLHYDNEYEPHLEIFLEIFRCNIEVLPNRKREFYAWLDAVNADNAVDDEDGDDDDE